jgi:hypothetical protein
MIEFRWGARSSHAIVVADRWAHRLLRLLLRALFVDVGSKVPARRVCPPRPAHTRLPFALYEPRSFAFIRSRSPSECAPHGSMRIPPKVTPTSAPARARRSFIPHRHSELASAMRNSAWLRARNRNHECANSAWSSSPQDRANQTERLCHADVHPSRGVVLHRARCAFVHLFSCQWRCVDRVDPPISDYPP